MKKWAEILVPLFIVVMSFYANAQVMEHRITELETTQDKIMESWLSPEDIIELKTAIKDLSAEVTHLKVAIAKRSSVQ
jgi:hypothetical protein